MPRHAHAKTIDTGLVRQLKRFPAGYHDKLEAFAAISQRCAQLAHTHPVLFFGIATGFGPRSARVEAVRRLEAGRPLAEVAHAAGWPNCFRRLPPAVCNGPFYQGRWTGEAERLLGALVPTNVRDGHLFLSATTFACRACDETFAAWAAREGLVLGRAYLLPALLPVAIHAWHSLNPGHPAAQMIVKPWSPRADARRALTGTFLWLRNLRDVVGFPRENIEVAWAVADKVSGYAFRPLLTQAQLTAEGRAMRHCVGGYGELLGGDICWLFSIRCERRRVATLEIRWDEYTDGLRIWQLKGRGNAECSAQVREAVESWLQRAHANRPRRREGSPPGTFAELLAPYRKATSNGDHRWASSLALTGLLANVREGIRDARHDAER